MLNLASEGAGLEVNLIACVGILSVNISLGYHSERFSRLTSIISDVFIRADSIHGDFFLEEYSFSMYAMLLCYSNALQIKTPFPFHYHFPTIHNNLHNSLARPDTLRLSLLPAFWHTSLTQEHL